MRLKAKILLLPLGAALVIGAGALASFFFSQRTFSHLERLQAEDVPALSSLIKINNAIDQFKLCIKASLATGDEAKLTTCQQSVDIVNHELAALKSVGADDKDMTKMFDMFQRGTFMWAKAILSSEEPGEAMKLIGASTSTVDKLMLSGVHDKLTEMADRSRSAAHAAQINLWSGVLCGVLVVFGLIVASLLLVRSVWNDLGAEPATLRLAMQGIAGGDLTQVLEVRDGDQDSLMAAMQRMQTGLTNVVTHVRANSESVAAASSQIARGNADMSQRTELQASSLQRAASTMEELSGTVNSTSENAQKANDLAQGANKVAVKGGEVVQAAVGTMRGINDASRKIEEISGLIDSIAFQTNILALNAAVEAARAGDQGRGFAVVAGEVRTLAQRSASAAREIKTLISSTVDQVDRGSKLVDEAGNMMREIVGAFERVSVVVSEITSASLEQTSSVRNVSDSVSHVEQATQQNAALVEQSAAAAASLEDQANNLLQAVEVFKLAQQAA